MAIQIAPPSSALRKQSLAKKTLARSNLTTATTRTNVKSRIESLPNEVLMRIFTYVTLPSCSESLRWEMPSNTNGSTPKHQTRLRSSILVSRHFYTTGIAILYRDLKFSSTTKLRQLRNVILQRPDLGRHVRSVDFSALKFNTQVLTPLLRRMPLLREIVLGNVDTETSVDRELWNCLFHELVHLESVSLTRCQVDEMAPKGPNSTANPARSSSRIQNLSIKGQDLKRQNDFDNLLGRQKQLKSLCLSNSSFSATSLMALPSTIRLETLNLHNFIHDKQDRADITQLITFLTTHPSITSSLKSLTLTSPSPSQSSLQPPDITHLLTHRSPTLTTLNLKNTPFTTHHVPLLHSLPNLQSLHPGNTTPTFTIHDAESLILGASHAYTPSDLLFNPEHFTYEGLQDTSISPLCKAMFSTRLKMRLNSVVARSSSVTVCSSNRFDRSDSDETRQHSKLRYIDLSDLPLGEAVKIVDSVLWSDASRPLEVIELSPRLVEWKGGLLKELVKSVGWKVRSVGRRCWAERREL